MKDGIYIGVEAHGHLWNGTTPRVSALEFSFPIQSLPELSLVDKVNRMQVRPVWRITISDLESEQKYFLHAGWPVFVNALDPLRDTLILSLERSSEYDAKHLDLLREIVEALFPLRCFLEFEHHSWKHAANVLRGAKSLVVQHDAPELPGIIKDISVPGKHALLRLLGRNKRTWFEHNPSERFAYQYSQTELSSIAKRIYALREESDSVTIIVATHPPQSAMEAANSFASVVSSMGVYISLSCHSRE